MQSINLALVDDEQIHRNLISKVLEEYNDLNLAIEGSNGLDLIQWLRLEPQSIDIIILGLESTEFNVKQLAKFLKKEHPSIKLVLLTTHYTEDLIKSMIEMEATGYIVLDNASDKLVHTLKEVANHGYYYDKHVMEVIKAHLNTSSPGNSVAFGQVKLTRRELEILNLICEEKTTNQIAQELFLSPRTIEGHRNHLLEKTGSRNTAGLVIYAVKHKIVNLETIPQRVYVRR